ncbi:collagen-like protein [Lactiplantibacillus plantarum]|uniref:collagen-like protein n=1 Tax=Lactiplantibacillus plantarum TaxID=1590 RepID=UPI003F5304D6
MAKTLSFTDMSPQTVKIGDTTTSFSLICGNDNVATDLTKATSITVKLGNASGYLKSATVDPASLTDPTTGQVTVNFNADLMTSLTAGSYAIEVWVVDPTGTSIYPSDGSTGFTITNNIQSANGSVITTITFDDFVKAMNKAASTIDKGDKGDDGLSAYQVAVINGYHGSQTDWLASLKGDTGTVDNTGLISAPAFQSLQTQVNNSAVGTNLLTGTSSDLQAAPDSPNNANGGTLHNFSSDELKSLASNPVTARAFIHNTTTHTVNLVVWTNGTKFGVGTGVPAGTDGYSTITAYSASSSAIVGDIDIRAYTDNVAISGVQYKELKIEKGSVATDWCPNPAEVLTQSDYAKIKAAIVALGGALS